MRYSVALIKISIARAHADSIKKELDMALTPSCPGVDGWEDTVDKSILQAYYDSQHLLDTLSEVVVDIEAKEEAEKLLAAADASQEQGER